MSDLDYGFDSGERRSSGSSRVRLVLIFLLVSAVTAALVWWFWPRNEEKKDGAASAAASVKPSAAPSAPAPAGGAKKDEKKPASPASFSSDGKDKAPGTSAAPSAPAPAGSADAKKNDPADPPLPAKGVLTPADQQGKDLPAVAVGEEPDPARQALLKEAAGHLAQSRFAQAEEAAEKALKGEKENTAFYREAWRTLSAARTGLILTAKSGRWLIPYRINPGDSLSGIASRHRTTVELIKKRNNIVGGNRIFVGKTLYLTPGDWRIEVGRKSRLLKLLRVDKEGKEELFGVWEVGVGRMGKTPAAEFAIAARVKHPDWYLPDGRVFKYGQPENQLGEYFLKLAPVTAPGRPLLGYGIHGAQDESAVGKSLSNGCVRMRNAEVEALYYLVPAGTRVVIKDE